VLCPAKVNLALSVGAPDASGMHPIASWMVGLRFGDTLRVSCGEKDLSDEQRFAVRFADDAPVPGVVDWPRGKDLAWRALQLLEHHAGRRLPVRLEIIKRVPTGAGCGGGSSDAAGVLAAVNEVCSLGLIPTELARMGLSLGSDVGFATLAMTGSPSVLVSGLGDTFSPVALQRPLHVVLILPELKCPTSAVYQAFDRLCSDARGADTPAVQQVVARLRDGKPGRELFNDLAEPAVHVTPGLGELLETLRDTLALPAHVTGSGAACFCVAADATQAQQWVRLITQKTGAAAMATQTLTASDPLITTE